MPAEMTLFSDARYFSPWVLTVWAALEEKKLPFRVQAFDLQRGENRQGDFPRRTLTGKVPALRHGDDWLGESMAILEYLEEVFAPPKHAPLLPAAAVARARDRQIMLWLRSDLFALRECMPYEGIFDAKFATPPLSEQGRAEAEKLLAAVATRLPLKGEPTWADMELGFTMQRLIRHGYDLSRHAEALAYAKQIWQRPSVQGWVKHKRPLLARG